MKRDAELMSKILFAFEAHPGDRMELGSLSKLLRGNSAEPDIETVLHHVELLIDRGHLTEFATDKSRQFRLTDAGHDAITRDPQTTLDTFKRPGQS